MKRFAVLVPALLSTLIVGTGLSLALMSTEPVFEMTDGYFQVVGSKPMHLTHSMDDYWLHADDAIDIYLNFRLKQNKQSPCDGNTEDCIVTMEFVPQDMQKGVVQSPKRPKHWLGEQTGFVVHDRVPKSISSGRWTVRVLITKDGVEYFRFDIPIVVAS